MEIPPALNCTRVEIIDKIGSLPETVAGAARLNGANVPIWKSTDRVA